MDWNSIWETVKNFFVNSGWRLLEAIGILIAGIIIIKIVVFIGKKIFSRTKMEGITQKFVLNIIKYLLDLVLIFILLQFIGIPITGLVTILTTAGLAIILALKDSLSNLANGIILMTVKSFKEGDFLNINGIEGKVISINLMSTKIVSLDNKLISIPNSQILNNAVINYDANKLRRVDFTFSVAYETDVEKTKNIIKEVMLSNGCVKKDPAPFASLKTLNESSIDIFSYCWVDTEDYWNVYYYIMDKVFNEFKRNKISIPFNQYEVRLREDNVKMPFDTKKLPDRIEKVKVEQEGFSNAVLGIIKSNKKNREQKRAEKAKKLELKLNKKAIKLAKKNHIPDEVIYTQIKKDKKSANEVSKVEKINQKDVKQKVSSTNSKIVNKNIKPNVKSKANPSKTTQNKTT